MRERKRLSEQVESSRIEKFEAERANKEKRMELTKKNSAWSQKSRIKEERDKRKEKKKRKRMWGKREEAEQAEREQRARADAEDWEEMAEDEREAKKTKRAKIMSTGNVRGFIGL